MILYYLISFLLHLILLYILANFGDLLEKEGYTQSKLIKKENVVLSIGYRVSLNKNDGKVQKLSSIKSDFKKIEEVKKIKKGKDTIENQNKTKYTGKSISESFIYEERVVNKDESTTDKENFLDKESENIEKGTYDEGTTNKIEREYSPSVEKMHDNNIADEERTGSNGDGSDAYLNFDKDAFIENLRQIIIENIEYPVVARRMGWEGTVLIGFSIDPEKGVSDVKILSSSGYSLLDEYTIDTIKKISRFFPKPPVKISLRIPVHYHLD